MPYPIDTIIEKPYYLITTNMIDSARFFHMSDSSVSVVHYYSKGLHDSTNWPNYFSSPYRNLFK